MIQYIKHILLGLFFLFQFCLVGAQTNIVSDCSRSKEFARYLYFTHQYELARHELERINYFCDPDSSIQLLLLQSLRKLELFPEANRFFNQAQHFSAYLSQEYRNEYIRLQMVQGRYDEVLGHIHSGMVFDQQPEHHLGVLLLKQDWKQAYSQSLNYSGIESIKMNALRGIAVKGVSLGRKSPWLAALMSVILPGSGKIYCGYWGDGAIAFTFSASTAFLAVRAFNKYGSDSVYPWIVSGLAASYYLGNIYGGHKAAERYNHQINHQLTHEAQEALFSDY